MRSYILDDGKDAIELWYDKQIPEMQAAFIVALDTLRGYPRKFWRQSLFDELGQSGQTACAGLRRIKIVHKPRGGNEVQERILAFEGPEASELTLLLGFSKGDDPDYSKCCPEAQDRKAKALNDKNRTRECKF